VYAVGHAGLSHHGRWKAATLAVRGAVLSHRSAAELWGLLQPRGGAPTVSVPYPASPGRRPDIRIVRSRTLARARTTSREGIPVTMPARTLADLARIASAADVRRATREAEVRGLPLDPGHFPYLTDSDLEDAFLALCRRHRVPPPEVGARVGRYRVDFVWREERLIAETDGYLYHRGRQAFHEDRERDIELELAGFAVVRFDDLRIEKDPASVAADVLALLANRAP